MELLTYFGDGGAKLSTDQMIWLLSNEQQHENEQVKVILKQGYSEYKHSLTFRVWRYVAIVVKPMHRLQIRPILHN